MTPATIARLRHEAAEHRAQARRLDALAREARERHDPLRELQRRSEARARRALAKVLDGEVQDWRLAQRVSRIIARHHGAEVTS